jgi:hypothetical protein
MIGIRVTFLYVELMRQARRAVFRSAILKSGPHCAWMAEGRSLALGHLGPLYPISPTSSMTARQ